MKNRYGRTTSKAIVAFAVALIAVLVVFSGYEFMRADALSQTFSQTQIQTDDLQNQVQDMQEQYTSLQGKNTSLESQNKALQDKINAIPPAPTPKPDELDPNKKVAYLTIDDGPSEYTPKLLSELKNLNVKATFFVTFQFGDTPDKRALIKQEADDGNTIGVHSWSHKYQICYANEQGFLDDFNRMANAIKQITGITPNLNRFPGGTDNTVSMTYSHEILMPTVEKDVVAMGYKTFDWNAGGEDADPTNPSTTSDQFVRQILNDVGSQKKVVILMHDTIGLSVNAVPDVVRELRSEGYTFETLTPASPTCFNGYAKPRNGLQDASSNTDSTVES